MPAPRILFVSAFRSGTDGGGVQRRLLLERSLQTIGELDVLQCPPLHGLPSWLHGPGLELTDADVAAASNWSLLRSSWLPLGRARKAWFAAFRPETYDIVFMHRLATCWWTRWTDTRRTLVDVDDIPSTVLRQELDTSQSYRRLFAKARYLRVRMSERRLPDNYRTCFVCSDDDAAYWNHDRVEVLPNCYWPTDEMDHPITSPESPSLLFVGSFHWEPNVVGLEWFVQHVLPRIRRKVENASLTVVGSLPKWTLPDLLARVSKACAEPGIQTAFNVPSLGPYIRGCSFEVCPLLSGGGTRIKIIECLAHGKPVVSTSRGAYGLSTDEAQGVIRRDTPESFADACIALLRTPKRCIELGTAGRTVVRHKHHPDAMQRRLHGIVEQTLSTATR